MLGLPEGSPGPRSEQVLPTPRRPSLVRLSRRGADTLSAAFLARSAPAPADLLARFRLTRRTTNTLLRYLAGATLRGEAWTYGRFLAIPGFGMAALADVLSAPPLRPSRAPSTLDQELAQLITSTGDRPATAPTPFLDIAMELIARRLPASESDITRMLKAEGLIRGPIDFGSIERAARFHPRPPPFAILRRDGVVVAVPHERLALSKTTYDLAVRGIAVWGLCTISQLCYRVGTEAVDFVTALLTAHRSFSWLDRKLGWFWFRNLRSSLVRTIETILSATSTVALADLGRTLFRRWPPSEVPPLRVLGHLCRQVPHLRIEKRWVRLVGS